MNATLFLQIEKNPFPINKNSIFNQFKYGFIITVSKLLIDTIILI